MFLNNRYHDPTLGVFISVDPLVAATGEAYIYASGNPTTLSDPTGLCPYCVAAVPVAEAGIGVYVVVALVGTTVVWGVACGVSDCPYDLTDAMSSVASGGWEASKWVVGASVDAGKAIGGAAADAGSAVGNAADSLWDGATGLFQDRGDRERRLVDDEDELLAAAEEAAGGDLDALDEFKPGWYQGERPDGQVVKIEVELEGHQSTNEGPHVTVRVPKDPVNAPNGPWKVIEKIFIEGRETWRSTGGSW